ncbi:hypothetical protein JCM11251_002872 [Rhodosporidiobolus azoricus]
MSTSTVRRASDQDAEKRDVGNAAGGATTIKGGKGSEPALSASLVLLSPLPAPAADGCDYRVLLLKRHAQSRTYDSAHVFPGGNIDPADSSASLQSFLAPPQSLSPSYTSPRSPSLLRTLTLTALRETFEESGLLLLSPSCSSDEVLRVWAAKGAEERSRWRERVHKDGAAMEKLLSELEEEGAGKVRLAADGLREWGRWITPEAVPRRYDTTFFLSLLPSFSSSNSSPPTPPSSAAPPSSSTQSVHLALSDGTETTLAEWLTPGEAITRALRYTKKLQEGTTEPPAPGAVGAEDSGAVGDDEGILLHPPQFNLLAELALNHPSYRSLLLPPSSDFSFAPKSYPPIPYPMVLKTRNVPTYVPRLIRVKEGGRRATVLPGDEEYEVEMQGKGEEQKGRKRRNRTYVLPPEKGKAGLIVEGVHRKGMLELFGEGWEDMRAGDAEMPLPPPVSSAELHLNRSRSNGALPVSPSPLPPPSSSGSRLKLRLQVDRGVYVAGQTVTGTLEVDVKIKKGAQVALGDLGCELNGLAEMRSRTHTSTRRLLTQRLDFQGHGRPPSSAVVPQSLPLQGNFYPALPGRTRFAFSFIIPAESPSSCSLGNGTATTRYELAAFASALIDGNVDIKSEKTVITVVERWADWRKGPWAVEGGTEKRAAEKLAMGGDGKVEVKASVGKGEWTERPPRLFWRRDKESGIEGKGAVRVEVRVRNASKRHVTGIKLTLLRRLRLLPSPGQPSPSPDSDAPIVTSTILTERFHGIDYDVASNSERDMQVAVQVPPDTECWTVRRAGLFEIDCVLRVEVECGFLSKNLFVDLPIWVAHPVSLPNSAHRFAVEEQRRLGLVPAPSPATAQLRLPPSLSGPGDAPGVPYHRPVSPLSSIAGVPHSPSFDPYHSRPSSPSYYPYPASNPNSPSVLDFASASQLPLPGSAEAPTGFHSPSPASPAFAPPQPQYAGTAVGYAESSVSNSPSFYQPSTTPGPPHFAAPPPPPPSLSQVAHYHPAHPAAEFASHHVHPHSHCHPGGYVHFNPAAPDLTPSRFLGGVLSTHQPTHTPGSAIPAASASEAGVAIPLSPPPTCPSPAPSAVVPPPPTQAQFKEMFPHLPPHEQQQVFERISSPVPAYSAIERAHVHPRTASLNGVSYAPERRNQQHDHEQHLQRDLPAVPLPPQASPPRTCPSPVPSLRSSRTARATPPPPSPSSGSSLRRSPSPSPAALSPSRSSSSSAAPAQYAPLPANTDMLETIGEDGESQAGGTAKSQMVGEGMVEALRREGEEHARQQEEEKAQLRASEKEKADRRKSWAEELEMLAEREDKRREQDQQAMVKEDKVEKTLPPLPTAATPSRPSVMDVFSSPAPTAAAAASPAKSPSPLPPKRDPSGLSALEARLLARSPSPNKPSSPSLPSPPLASFPATSTSPTAAATLAAPEGPSALRARSLSRASRIKEDEEYRRKIEEAERDPGEAVRRARQEMGWYASSETSGSSERSAAGGEEPVKGEKADKVEDKSEEVEEKLVEEKEVIVEAKVVRRALPTPPASYTPSASTIASPASAAAVSPVTAPSSLKPSRPVFSSRPSASAKRHTLPALPVEAGPLSAPPADEPPHAKTPAEQAFEPPTPALPKKLAAPTGPIAILKRGLSPVARSTPNPWTTSSSRADAAGPPSPRRDASPSRVLPSSPQRASSATVPPASPVDASGRKIVDRPELKELKRDAVNRITGWLKDNGVDPSSPGGASVTYLAEERSELTRSPSFAVGGNTAGENSRKRRTIEFGRLAPAPPSSVSGSSPLLGVSTTSSTNSASLSAGPSLRPAHKHSLSVPTASSPKPPSTTEPTVAQLLAAETRAALRQVRIGSPPPWSPDGQGKSAVEKGTEGYLAALRKDEEGPATVEAYERSARKLQEGKKVKSVVGIWAEREEEAAREGTATPPLPPLRTSGARRHQKSAKSLSFLPHSATSPALSSSTNSQSPVAPRTSHVSPLTSVGNAPARLVGRDAAPSPSAPRSSPAKPFLNTTLGKPASSAAAGRPALRVPSGGGGKMVASESAPNLTERAPPSGVKVKDLLARYQQQAKV